jgi:hypothetical protein
MSLQLRLFGGGQTTAGKLSASNDGSHAIDKSKVLAQTDALVITPNTPGNFSSIRSVPVVPDPRYFTKEEADAMKGLAKDKTDGARQSKRAYTPAKIEAADKTVHQQHRKYEGAVAENELGKKRADAGLAKKLHGLRPGYAHLGLGIDKADSDARTRIYAIKAKLTGGSN